MHLLSDMIEGKYVALKRTAEDRKEWQILKRAGSHTHNSSNPINYYCYKTNTVVFTKSCSIKVK